jgi:hypothetical protein
MTSIICRHIMPSGHRCGSPALRGQPRCYHHDRSYRRHRLHEVGLRAAAEEAVATVARMHPETIGPDGEPREKLLVRYYTQPVPPLQFPALEDRGSIQMALSMVLRAITRQEITPGQASQYLYCLQIASANLKGIPATPWQQPVEDVLVDEEGYELAPDEDPATFTAHLKQLEEQERLENVPQNAGMSTQVGAITL